MSLQIEIERLNGLRIVNKYVNNLIGINKIVTNQTIAGMLYNFVYKHYHNKVQSETNNYIKSANLAIDLLGYIPVNELMKLKDLYVRQGDHPDKLYIYCNKFMSIRLHKELQLRIINTIQ